VEQGAVAILFRYDRRPVGAAGGLDFAEKGRHLSALVEKLYKTQSSA
jgi:hypothetical protein